MASTNLNPSNYTAEDGVFANCLNAAASSLNRSCPGSDVDVTSTTTTPRYPKLAAAYHFHQLQYQQRQQPATNEDKDDVVDGCTADNKVDHNAITSSTSTTSMNDNKIGSGGESCAMDSPALRALLTNKQLRYESVYGSNNSSPPQSDKDLDQREHVAMMTMTLQNMTPPLSPNNNTTNTNTSDGSSMMVGQDWSEPIDAGK